jgi:hypothetical protein
VVPVVIAVPVSITVAATITISIPIKVPVIVPPVFEAHERATVAVVEAAELPASRHPVAMRLIA